MATHLNVRGELAITYRESPLRTEQATYVRPRLGAGGWTRKIEVA